MLPCGVGNQPWLIAALGSDKETQTFINPLATSIEEMKIPEMVGQVCLARFEECLFLVDRTLPNFFLLNIYSLAKIHLPFIEEPPASLSTRIILTSPTSSPYCTVIFFGSEKNFLLFCRPCDKEWTKLPVDFDVTQVHRMLMYKEKLYVILLNNIQIIDLGSLFKNYVETSSIKKPHFASFGMGRAEHLVESCGNLFFVQTCSPGIQTLSIIDLGIFKFDCSNEGSSWVRVESIGDCAFFLDQFGGQSICKQDARVDQNCIYQMVPPCYDGNRLYKVCLDNQTINFDLLQAAEDQGLFFWVLPVRQPVLKSYLFTSSETIVCSEICQNNVRQLKKHENNEEDALSMPLADLTIDMVQLISEKLPLKDSGRLQAVCKQWTNLLTPIKEDRVWLMYCPLKGGTCRMYNPFQGKEFILNLKKLSSDKLTRLLFSKDGWVLALEGIEKLIFHSLLRQTLQIVWIFAISGSFSGEITNIMAWHYGQEEWFHMKFTNDCLFHVADNNPVFIDGEFYCLGKMGNLGVFNLEKHTWRILNNPSPIYSKAPEIGKDKECCYLLKYSNELISVFQAIDTDYVRVDKLDRSKMAWALLENLGNLTLFLDFRTSIARALPCKSYSNKLYLPRFHDGSSKAAFYYCMKTGMYNPNFKSLGVPYNCVWLEPNLNGLK